MRAVVESGLDPKYIVFAFARFLDEDEFETLRSQMKVGLPYREARALFIQYEPVQLESGGVNPPGEISGSDGFPSR